MAKAAKSIGVTKNDDREMPVDDDAKAQALDDPGSGFDDLRRIDTTVVQEEAAQAAGQDKPEGGDDDDLGNLTKAMRKRIMRVRRAAEREIASKTTEFQATIEQQNKRIADLERRTKAAGGDDDQTMKDLEKQLETAMEAGDSKKVAALNRQMAEAAVRTMPAHEVDEPEDLDSGKDKTAKSKAGPAAEAKVIPRVQEWLDGQEWWNRPDHAHIVSFVREKVDRKLQAAGYSPKEDAYFEELERILDERFPGVVVKSSVSDQERRFSEMLGDEEDEDDLKITPRANGKRQAARAPVMGADDGADAGSGNDQPRRRGTRVTAEEVQTMRTFKMDPTDPKQVDSFRRYKGSSAS